MRDDARPNHRRQLLIASALLLLLSGGYLLSLALLPELKWRLGTPQVNHPEPIAAAATNPAATGGSSPEPAAAEQAPTDLPEPTRYDTPNRVIIDKVGIDLEIVESTSAEALNRGSWHRKPEQGNPEIGNNFILTGHRFGLGLTPGDVVRNSAFYNLDKLENGDMVTVYWNQQKYLYEITDKQRANPNAAWIEESSQEHKLTLYTCTLGGESDGRVVLTARPLSADPIAQ